MFEGTVQGGKQKMRLQDLGRMKEAPLCGQLLAYTRKRVLFQQYGNTDELKSILGEEELLELHLFDAQKEYRCIASGSRRFPSGVIEAVIDFPEKDETSVFKEEVPLEDKKGIITVLNHIAYNEKNGMAYVDNYRLRM